MENAELEGVLDGVLGPLIVLDAQGRIVFATESAQALVKVDLERGTPLAKVLCGQGHQRPLADALAAGESIQARISRYPQEDLDVRAFHVPAPRTSLNHKHIAVLLAPAARMLQERGDLSVTATEERERTRGRDALNEAVLADAHDPGLIELHGVRTASPVMKRLLRDALRVAPRRSTVLIRGESGSGKEHIARLLHDASPRASRPFLAVNCAALTGDVIESILFGHVRGAFTGAHIEHLGYFRAADGGTLFLDEIGELPLPVQAKLLRVLEAREVLPVGAVSPVPVDVRIVAATHRSLRDQVAVGAFRADLMYRLRVVPLFLPPLRERPEDIAPLARLFIEQLNARETRQVLGLLPATRAQLEAFPWPGNVRELLNAIEYAHVLGDGPWLTPGELPPELGSIAASGDNLAPKAALPLAGTASADGQTRRAARELLTALERHAGHKGRTAQSLGISRATLWRRLKRLDLLAHATIANSPA